MEVELFTPVYKANKENVKVIISPHDFGKNPEFPNIEDIEMANELYKIIIDELKEIK